MLTRLLSSISKPGGLTVAVLFGSFLSLAQPIPELLFYQFDGAGTTVPNMATNPPAGTATATIMGGVTQGSTGLCGGALIGTGTAASSDYLNTGYVTALPTSWTISFWTKDFGPSSTLYYIFGDNSAGSFRCFTNGVAGADNWILRGTGITDVLINGGATVAPHVCTYVYDGTTNNIYGYLDGTLVNTVAQTGAVAVSGTGPFKVMGYSTNVGAPSGGLMDEFRLYDRALSPAEVLELQSPGGASTEVVNACDSYFWAADNNTYTTTGTYSTTVVGANGCDSVLTLELTVNTSVVGGTDTIVTCDSYNWAVNGMDYIATGIYTDTLSTVLGCDSLVMLNLTINTSTTSTITEAAIDSYTAPSGAVYTSSGTYTDIIPNAAGCDSTITINLTVEYTGLMEIAENAVVLFPNPAQDYIRLSGIDEISGISRTYITNVSGERAMNISDPTSQIFIEDLLPGVYFLHIESDRGTIQLKFIKQ